MLLNPRKFFHKNIFKRRFFRLFKKSQKLIYGNVALQITQPLRLTNKIILRQKLFLKKATKKTDKTLRKV